MTHDRNHLSLTSRAVVSLKILGSIAALTMVLTMLAAVASASAAETELCKANEHPCAGGDAYGAPLEISASSSNFTLEVPGYNATVKCNSSELKGNTTAERGEPLPLKLTNWVNSGCYDGVPPSPWESCTVSTEGLPYRGSLLVADASGNGILGIARPSWHYKCQGNPKAADCTYQVAESELPSEFLGGSPAKIKFTKVPVLASGNYCPGGNGTVSAEYTVNVPKPVFVTGEFETATGTVLCKASESLCSIGHTYPAKTTLGATLKPTHLQIVNSSGHLVSACGKSSLEARTSAEVGTPLPGEAGQLSFSECSGPLGESCTVEALSLPYNTQIEPTSGGNGTLTVKNGGKGEPRLKSHCKGLVESTCVYSAEGLSFELGGGNPASLSLSKEQHELKEGPNSFCGTSGKVEGAYTLNAPAPLYIASRL